jgi:hypothetical protein
MLSCLMSLPANMEPFQTHGITKEDGYVFWDHYYSQI